MTLADHIYRHFGLAVNLTGNEYDARELLQDLAVKVFANVDYYKGRTQEEISRLLNTSLRNLSIDKYRSAQRRFAFQYLDDGDDWWRDQDGLFNIASVSNEYYVNSLRNDFHITLQAMDKNWATAIRLAVQGYGFNEIADIMNTKINTVGGYIRYARQYIKQQLAA